MCVLSFVLQFLLNPDDCPEYLDLIKSQRMWLQHAKGLPTYSQGKGWFNVGDIISLMPLELTCRILGIKCWVSETMLFYIIFDSFLALKNI